VYKIDLIDAFYYGGCAGKSQGLEMVTVGNAEVLVLPFTPTASYFCII